MNWLNNAIMVWILTLVLCGMLAFSMVNCAESSESPANKQSEGIDDYDFYYHNVIFPRTSEITLYITPTEGSTTPNFSWNAVYSPFSVVMIFDNRIDIDDRNNYPTITNPEDAVWLWNSDMATGRAGNVTFYDGVDVQGGDPQSGSPTPLQEGVYYIGLWTYSNDMFPNYSSKEIQYDTRDSQ